MVNNRNKEQQIHGLYEQYDAHAKYNYHQTSVIENNIRKFYDYSGPFKSVAMNGFIQI